MPEWYEEVVATCPGCGKPVRRNQPRKLVGQRREDREWWKEAPTGGQLAHLGCAKKEGE